jgi:hypothetical protein
VFSSFARPCPARNDVSAEVEESSLLDAVIGKRLVKTLQVGKYLVRVLLICKLWRDQQWRCN